MKIKSEYLREIYKDFCDLCDDQIIELDNLVQIEKDNRFLNVKKNKNKEHVLRFEKTIIEVVGLISFLSLAGFSFLGVFVYQQTFFNLHIFENLFVGSMFICLLILFSLNIFLKKVREEEKK